MAKTKGEKAKGWRDYLTHAFCLIFLLPVGTILLGFTLNLHHSEPSSRIVAYPEHLPGAFTGGFGEPTCRSCHFDYEINPDGGSFSVSGITEEETSGELLKIQITLQRDELGGAGFQLSARYRDGSQAGRFKIEDNKRVTFTKAAPDSLQYVQHSYAGTEPIESGKNSWTVRWQAPKSAGQIVVFNIAANAANGDQSVFGDFIYEREIKIKL